MAMQLARIYAYSVTQQRGAGEGFEPPDGGGVTINNEIRTTLANAQRDALNAQPTKVVLNVDKNRSSPVKQAVEALADDDEVRADEAARSLAVRLNRVMDMRSKVGLLIAAVNTGTGRELDKREVALWVFPRDTFFRHEPSKHRLDVIEEAFSRSSTQRKLALFSGRRLRDEFRTAVVLDYQARGTLARVAAFWIKDFLDAEPDTTSEQGSRILADVFVAAAKKATDAGDLDQLQAAVVALRHAPSRQRSLTGVADDFLEGRARSLFDEEAKRKVPDDRSRQTLFPLNRKVFADNVGYRFFRLDAGTRVIAPIDAIGDGKTVQITDSATTTNAQRQRVLRIADTIVEERLRRRA
jgi:hypothetical protein